jgi:hypothetical protein
MYRLPKQVATFASTAVLLFARPDISIADPIRIIVGEQNINGGGIVGNPAGGVDSATIDAHACHPCEVGQTASFAGAMRGTFFGTLRADGRTFELGGFNEAFLSLTLTAPSFLLRPPMTSGTWSVHTPFAYSALLSFEDLVAEDTFEHREFGFAGSGSATGSFVVSPFPETGGTQINFAGAIFDIGASTPTPEPASLALLSTGLGGVLIRTVRRRVRAKPAVTSRR